MAIEEMKLLSVVGKEKYIDNFIAEYLIDCGIQPEDAIKVFDKGWKLSYFNYDNRARNLQKQCKEAMKVLEMQEVEHQEKVKLDEVQKLAVTTPGNILLIAGAGAGKTFTITQKIIYLIENKIYAPEEILIISFTNKSVADLQKKINYNCSILTFHKLAIQILRDYNINFNLVNDTYLEFLTNEFFQSLDDSKLIKEILLYFKEYDYQKFLKTYKYQEFKKLLITILKIYKTNGCTKDDFQRIYPKNNLLSPVSAARRSKTGCCSPLR